jgi:D-sedoheptulose 7-phosphate isomerase
MHPINTEMQAETRELFLACLDEMAMVTQELKTQIPVLNKIVGELSYVRNVGGRVFFCGVGGGAGNGTHACGDLFKSCQIQTICLTDNIPTLTAITNDEGWWQAFSDQLMTWKICDNDALFVLSVGGGDEAKNVSANIVRAVILAKDRGASVLGIVGKPDGFTAQNGDAVVVVPTVNLSRRTSHTEGMQAYLLHFVTEALRQRSAKWESME